MIAKLLLERETLDGRDAEDLLKFGRIRSEEERALAAGVAAAEIPLVVPPPTAGSPVAA